MSLNHPSNVATMRNIAFHIDVALPLVDPIDTLTAIQLEEALQQVRGWLRMYGPAGSEEET